MNQQTLKNIYVVEDDGSQRHMIIDFLSQYEGTVVKGFLTGDACIKEIVNNQTVVPDLIIIDYYLDATIASKYDGLDTVTKINEICPEAKLVMFTSVDNERIMKLALERGASDYIMKEKEGFDTLGAFIERNFEIN